MSSPLCDRRIRALENDRPTQTRRLRRVAAVPFVMLLSMAAACTSSDHHEGTPHVHNGVTVAAKTPQRTAKPSAPATSKDSVKKPSSSKTYTTPTAAGTSRTETLPANTFIATVSTGDNIDPHSNSPQQSFYIYEQPGEGWHHSQGGISGRYAWQFAASTRLCSDPYVIFFFIGMPSGRYRGYFHVPDVSGLTGYPVLVDGFGPEALVNERAHAGQWVPVGEVATTNSADGTPDLQIEASESTTQPGSATTCDHSTDRVAWDAMKILKIS